MQQTANPGTGLYDIANSESLCFQGICIENLKISGILYNFCAFYGNRL